MRMLINIGFPTPEFNKMVAAGTAGPTLMEILEEQKPEAVYFTEHNGGRGAVIIIDLPDPAHIPALYEPWFLKFNATVESRIVMSPADLAKGDLGTLAKHWAQA